MQTSKILVTCPKGIPPFLRQELLDLNLPIESEQVAGIETRGTFSDALRLNLWVRTGHRVLVLVKDFTARNGDELYRQVFSLPWEELIPENGYVCVTSSVDNPSITDTRYATLKCKDGIVDRIKERCGIRPDSGGLREHTVVHLYWKHDQCSIYLDTSGVPLSKRGYRKIPLAAPMQETLAAAVVRATGWEGTGNFINPMCGSGTLAIEAALIGLGRAPGLYRGNFGFMHRKGYREDEWNELRENAKRSAKKVFAGRILASDISSQAVEAARKNALTAGVEHLIEFSVCPLSDVTLPEGPGVIVLNPEYGERMGEIHRLTVLYKEIGDYFKQKCGGYTCHVFTGNTTLAKKVGLKPRRTLQFFNSSIECRLLEFDIYEGSKKPVKAPKDTAGVRTEPAKSE